MPVSTCAADAPASVAAGAHAPAPAAAQSLTTDGARSIFLTPLTCGALSGAVHLRSSRSKGPCD